MSGIYIAFRRTAPVGAAWWQRALCALVRWRLVSQWCHAGVVCDGVLHHVTVTDGLTSTDSWTAARRIGRSLSGLEHGRSRRRFSILARGISCAFTSAGSLFLAFRA